MNKTQSKKSSTRLAYSFVEFAEMVGRERTWVYRQVKAGRIKSITGFGAALIPASELERFLEAANS